MSDQGFDINEFPLDDPQPAPSNIAEEFDRLQAENNPNLFNAIPLDEQRRNISLEYASRIHHDNVDTLLDAAVKVHKFLDGSWPETNTLDPE